jgi:hypothetical protein
MHGNKSAPNGLGADSENEIIKQVNINNKRATVAYDLNTHNKRMIGSQLTNNQYFNGP